MAKNYVSDGVGVYYKNAGEAAIKSGDLVVMGNIVGVSLVDIDVNTQGTVNIVGVWTLPKDTATALTIGQAVYWDATNKKCVSTGDTYAGVAIYDALATDPTAAIKINTGSAPAAA
jgi:predicted RecA/RadA family phage recombinase